MSAEVSSIDVVIVFVISAIQENLQKKTVLSVSASSDANAENYFNLQQRIIF